MSINYFVNFYIAKFLPFLSLLLFIYQLFCNYYFYLDIEQSKNNFVFTLTKFLYLISYLMTLISFIMTLITEPGYVTEETNEQFLNLYKETRKYSLMRANIHNEVKNLVKNFEDDNYDLYTDGLSSEDEKKFNETEHLTNLYNYCKKFRGSLAFDVKKCRQCHIIKVCGTVHCSVCHKCVYMKDHHCIWFNKCIGQFNLKYFILFSFYLFLSSLISFSRFLYYIIYKNYGILFSDFSFNKTIVLLSCILFDLTYSIFSFKLIYDQYTNLNYFCYMFDHKRKQFIEIRTKYEMLREDFGDDFGLNWFLPIKIGGFYNLIKNNKKRDFGYKRKND